MEDILTNTQLHVNGFTQYLPSTYAQLIACISRRHGTIDSFQVPVSGNERK